MLAASRQNVGSSAYHKHAQRNIDGHPKVRRPCLQNTKPLFRHLQIACKSAFQTDSKHLLLQSQYTPLNLLTSTSAPVTEGTMYDTDAFRYKPISPYSPSVTIPANDRKCSSLFVALHTQALPDSSSLMLS
jgi:hypothetical protein